jgi:hypothetical protein
LYRQSKAFPYILVRRTNTIIYSKNLPVKIAGSLKHLPIEATLAIILQGGKNLVSVGNFEITGKCFRIKYLPKKIVVKTFSFQLQVICTHNIY